MEGIKIYPNFKSDLVIVDLDSEATKDLLISSRKIQINDISRMKEWLKAGNGAEMSYLYKDQALLKREDLSLIINSSKTIISFLVNYNRPLKQDEEKGIVSRYAIGEDYHRLLPKLIENIIERNHIYENEYKIYTDTGPISDRLQSVNSGLGWIGKNSMLINRNIGSFTYIGECITDISIDNFSVPQTDLCGKCTKCISSCPTGAINLDRTIDSNKCISYQTIENRGVIGYNIASRMGRMVFGCDICNEVCPWNRNENTTGMEQILSKDYSNEMVLEKIAFIEKDEFNKKFSGSAIKRATYEGLARNSVIAIFNRDPKDKMLKEIESTFDDLRKKQIKEMKNWVQ